MQTVLLVDDDNDDLELVQEALGRHKFDGNVAVALNGQILMDQLNAPTAVPDLILLDLNMPLKNGFEALKEIKSDPKLKSIPVFILTASSKKEDEIRCFELGCNLFLRKPNSYTEYNQLVKIVLDFLQKKTGTSKE